MPYIILPNLQLVIFFVCLVIERFKKVFICRFAIGSIVVYYTTIFSHILNKVAKRIKLRIVKV